MGKIFDPVKWLKRVLPKDLEKSGLLNEKLEPKKRMLKAITRATAIEGKELTAEVYKTVDFYAQKEDRLREEGLRSWKREALNGQALLTQRLKSFLVYTEVQNQKAENKGRYYRWLPSSAETPDPEHALLYGRIFQEGEGDKQGHMPGERWGCQCGIEWLDEASGNREDELAYKANINRVNPKFRKKAEEMFYLATKRKHGKARPLYFQTVKGKEVAKLKKVTGQDLKGMRHELFPNGVRHTYLNHGNAAAEAKRNQVAVTGKDIALIPRIVAAYDKLKLSTHRTRAKGFKALEYQKKIGRKKYHYIEAISKLEGDTKPRLRTQSMWIKK